MTPPLRGRTTTELAVGAPPASFAAPGAHGEGNAAPNVVAATFRGRNPETYSLVQQRFQGLCHILCDALYLFWGTHTFRINLTGPLPSSPAPSAPMSRLRSQPLGFFDFAGVSLWGRDPDPTRPLQCLALPRPLWLRQPRTRKDGIRRSGAGSEFLRTWSPQRASLALPARRCCAWC